ncbi:MAG TPA: ribose 5-phosphate isomerase B [Gemmatimonadaceae bacterium]|nr:ribose 5-phosphate isomerase B [Gemmatimonadaceae bacterium]
MPNTETIAIATDHAGFEMKQKLVATLERMGYQVQDMGAHSLQPKDDYPVYAHPLAREVSEGEVKRGVLLCGTGLGMSYVANRYPHVRAAVVWDADVARLSREHNDANVLVLPARCLSDEEAVAILKTWLETPFDGGRHQRRIEEIELDHAPKE